VIALNLRPDRLRLDDRELKAVLEEGRRMIAEGIAGMGLRNPDGSLRPEFDEWHDNLNVNSERKGAST
jgi:hypothetical protein